MSGVRFQMTVRSLSGPALAELIGCLGQDCDENGFTGELLGMCLEESVRRLREGKRPRNREKKRKKAREVMG